MAASIRDRILFAIEEANSQGRKICAKDIEALNITSVPTINSKIHDLIDDGLIIGVHEQTDHGTRFNLYSVKWKQEDQLRRREINAMERIAAALESMSSGTPVQRGPKRNNSTFKQQRLR